MVSSSIPYLPSLSTYGAPIIISCLGDLVCVRAVGLLLGAVCHTVQRKCTGFYARARAFITHAAPFTSPILTVHMLHGYPFSKKY